MTQLPEISTLKSINPFTQQTLASYPLFDLKQLDAVLADVSKAQQSWQNSTVPQRSDLLRSLGKVLRQRRDELAALATNEMGKTFVSALAEVDKCADTCDFYAEHGPAMIVDEKVALDNGRQAVINYQPLGIVLAVMPWNFPYWQVFRCMIPAFMAGNAIVLKHASNVPGCALVIESVCREASVPENLMRTLLVPGNQAEALIAHPLVAAVSFTGSTDAGRKIAAVAGQHLKKCVLELGGSDAYLVLDDADLDIAIEKCVTSRLLNNGQSCIAAKRFLVADSLYGEFSRRYTEAFRTRVSGDPMLPSTDIGPLARPDLAQELAAQVKESVRLGAVLLCGGEYDSSNKDNAFYPPTVLANVRPGMPAFDQEMFGPVAALIRVHNEEEAIGLANQSRFGLGSGVFTRDPERALRVASRLQAGNCAINDFVRSDPRLPFGGVKESGYGRELSHLGLREFTNIQSVLIG